MAILDPNYTFAAAAWHGWENHLMPMRLPDVIAAVFSGRVPISREYQVVPWAELWCVEAVFAGHQVHLIGTRDKFQRYTCIVDAAAARIH